MSDLTKMGGIGEKLQDISIINQPINMFRLIIHTVNHTFMVLGDYELLAA